jgi:hypothetical protein
MSWLKILKEVFDIGHEVSHNKTWYASKTLWFNVILLVTYIAAKNGADLGLSKDEMDTIALAAATIGNCILRLLTRRPLQLSPRPGADNGRES